MNITASGRYEIDGNTLTVSLGTGVPALDSDSLLEQRFGHPLAHEFELHGEEAFRAQEEQLVCRLLADTGSDGVIALGGGSVLSPRVRAALTGHVTVLLEGGAARPAG